MRNVLVEKEFVAIGERERGRSDSRPKSARRVERMANGFRRTAVRVNALLTLTTPNDRKRRAARAASVARGLS